MADDKKTTPAKKKAVVARKQRYFVPALGKSVEASSLDEVADIVKKETSKPAKGEVTKG